MKKDISESLKGYTAGILAAAFYGLNPLFALPLYHGGMDVDSVLFFRYSFGVVMLAILMLVERKDFRLSFKESAQSFVLGIMFSLSSLMLYVSYNHMDAGLASTILFVYPLLVAVIMAVVFKERTNMLTIISILVAFAGIALLGSSGESGELNWTGVLSVIASSLAYAIYIVGINRSGLNLVPSQKLTFYVLVSGLMLYVVRLNGLQNLIWPKTSLEWSCAIASALFPTILSLFLMTIAIRRIGPTHASILGALEPVTALIVGVFVFSEDFTLRILSGIILVFASVMAVILKGRKAK